jgi:hypothetical protein
METLAWRATAIAVLSRVARGFSNWRKTSLATFCIDFAFSASSIKIQDLNASQ